MAGHLSVLSHVCVPSCIVNALRHTSCLYTRSTLHISAYQHSHVWISFLFKSSYRCTTTSSSIPQQPEQPVQPQPQQPNQLQPAQPSLYVPPHRRSDRLAALQPLGQQPAARKATRQPSQPSPPVDDHLDLFEDDNIILISTFHISHS